MSRSSLNVRPLAVIGCEVVGLVDQPRRKTAGSREFEATAEFPQMNTLAGKDGKERPRKQGKAKAAKAEQSSAATPARATAQTVPPARAHSSLRFPVRSLPGCRAA